METFVNISIIIRNWRNQYHILNEGASCFLDKNVIINIISTLKLILLLAFIIISFPMMIM